MFLNLDSLQKEKALRIVNLRVEGFTKSVYELEKDTGLIMDTFDIIKEITDCLKDKNTATVELEMYCLSIMDKQCHSGIEDEVRQIIKLFVDTGKRMYEQLLEHGLYKNDALVYVFGNCIMDNVMLVDKAAMLQNVKDELSARNQGVSCFRDPVWL